MTLNVEKARRKARDLIKEEEALRLIVYLCPAGLPTAGWGHRTNMPTRAIVSINQANQWLDEDIEKAFQSIGAAVIAKCNTNQLAALLSFVFNIGGKAFGASTLKRLILANDMGGAAEQFERWKKATVGGSLIELAGLTARREAERTLFVCDRDL